MPWYAGPPLLDRLETIPVEPPAVHGARLPVQLVLRGEGGTRWAAGRLAAGALKAGDEVVVLPSGTRTRVAEVRDADGTAEQVEAPLSVSIRLEDEVDLARGELIAAVEDAPSPTRELKATLCWLGDRPARERDRFLLKHGTRTVPARLDAISGRIEFETLEWPAAEELELNDIAHVSLRLGGEIAADPLRAVPRHRRVHPHRRGDERHRGRGHGLLEPLDLVVQREETLPGEREAVLGLQLAGVDVDVDLLVEGEQLEHRQRAVLDRAQVVARERELRARGQQQAVAVDVVRLAAWR